MATRIRKNMSKRGTGETFLYMPISDAWEMDCTLRKQDESKWRNPFIYHKFRRRAA